MLKIEIPAAELFNESDQTFAEKQGVALSLEHSLVSVSKWESKWCVPFLSKTEKTEDQMLDYIKGMTLTQNVDDSVYMQLSADNFDAIKEYIDLPMSATIVIDRDRKTSREIITAEIIYYWMIVLNVPFECQKWHLNRLLMLINVCSIKQQDPKKMHGKALAQENMTINAARRAKMNSKG